MLSFSVFLLGRRSHGSTKSQTSDSSQSATSDHTATDQSARKDEESSIRASQIADAATEAIKDIFPKSPSTAMISCLMFMKGAKWADGNQRASFTSLESWALAQRQAFESMLGSDLAQTPPSVRFFLLLVFSRGADWASENPKA